MTNILPTEDKALDEAIASAFADLASLSADEQGYQQAVDQLSKLYKLKHDAAEINLKSTDTVTKNALEQQKMDAEYDFAQLPFFKRMSPDTILTVAGNLALGLAVIKYEQRGVITSKVMTFMKKI